ncbi:GPR endopeptidase [Natranaerofaba carboxydovora]|uniref:GPR endopeptidase n=1 Tax=Natranaerofaba carboxydovora TaxID=2742683 RepID=UPI001F14869E|nr:GPR endopeptidase [Natranaerofaba carboxydovora]UMZ73066.1 Germination protease [Natranaerofaba carboxydovora]
MDTEQSFNTDLAIEAVEVKELLEATPRDEMSGVETTTSEEEGVTISRVSIKTPAAEKAMNKAMGNYVNIEAAGLRDKDTELQDRVTEIVARELKELAGFNDQMELLVVGLGNWNVTPDSIGPKVVEDLVITRHLLQLVPDRLGPGFRSMAGMAPGVMGITGMETAEIIKGVVEQLKPSMILAIDALSARNLDRLNTTVQIADNGISPGSGVGNKRMGINEQTMGVPVIAMGVPTVVDAVTIVSDVLSKFDGSSNNQQNQNTDYNKFRLINETLSPYGGASNKLMVTPKEVDSFADDISEVLAGSINAAVHPRVSEEGSHKYL